MTRPLYLDTDTVPPGALYVQKKDDGWYVEVEVLAGLHTIRSSTGRVLWTERRPGPEGLYRGEWIHGTQRSLRDPDRGRVILRDCDAPDGIPYQDRLDACWALADVSGGRYIVGATWAVTDPAAPSWETVGILGWEGLIYRTDDPGIMWRRKPRLDLDAVVVERTETGLVVRLPWGETCGVGGGLPEYALRELTPGRMVRITGAEVTRDGKIRGPVLLGVKEG